MSHQGSPPTNVPGQNTADLLTCLGQIIYCLPTPWTLIHAQPELTLQALEAPPSWPLLKMTWPQRKTTLHPLSEAAPCSATPPSLVLYSSCKSIALGTSLVVQWLSSHGSTAGAVVSIPGLDELGSHRLLCVAKKKKKTQNGKPFSAWLTILKMFRSEHSFYCRGFPSLLQHSLSFHVIIYYLRRDNLVWLSLN